MDAWNKGSHSFSLGANTRFIDRFPEEIQALQASTVEETTEGGVERNSFISRSAALGQTDDAGFSTATKVDWRSSSSNPKGLNVVTGIKNQGICGACWSFSVLAVLEAAVALGHGILNDYSEQELVDCDESNNGCNGGSFSSAFSYMKASGSRLYDDYLWVGVQGSCDAASYPAAAGMTEYTAVSKCDVDEAKRALWEVGPLSVSIDASCDEFMYYASGLFDTGCGSASNDHAVALVGFVDASDETNDLGADYFIAKNSWGTTWGVKGYMFIAASLIDPGAPSSSTATPCGVSGVLQQPLGVWPDATLAYTNTTYPPPSVPGNDDEDPGGGADDGSGSDNSASDVRCTDVLLNGQPMFDDDRYADDDEASYDAHKHSWQCKAVEWLASPHPWYVWVAVYGAAFLLILLLCSCARWCCKCVCKCCSSCARCLCPCCFNPDEEEGDKRRPVGTAVYVVRQERHHHHHRVVRQHSPPPPRGAGGGGASARGGGGVYGGGAGGGGGGCGGVHEPLVLAEEDDFVLEGSNAVGADDDYGQWTRQKYIPPDSQD